MKPLLGGLTYGQASRRDQLVFTHIRIGHTYLTHGFLLREEAPPECVSCREQLTIKHILLHCIDFNDIRSRHLKNNMNIEEVLKNENILNVLKFIKEAGLFYVI